MPKQYATLAGQPVLRRTVEVFQATPGIDGLQVVIAPGDEGHYHTAVEGMNLPPPVVGGASRQQSVLNGLEALDKLAQEEGKTVLFTSHILTDVERVADRVGMIREGSLRVKSSLEELKERTKRLVIEVGGAWEAGQVSVPGEVTRELRGRDLIIVTGSFGPEVEAGLRARHPRLTVEDLNLEDIFCALVGSRPGNGEISP